MKKMFSSMMEGFTKGMSVEDKKKMMACGEQMAAMCPCMPGKEMSNDQRANVREEKKAMAEQMMACCGGMKEMMSAFFKKTDSQPEDADKSKDS